MMARRRDATCPAQIQSATTQIQSTQTTQAGPFQFLMVDASTLTSTATQVLPGRNLIHAVYVSQEVAFFYDGPGTATNINGLRSLTGQLVGFAFASGSLGSAQSVTMDVRVENGLRIAGFGQGTNSQWIGIYYKPLP